MYKNRFDFCIGVYVLSQIRIVKNTFPDHIFHGPTQSICPAGQTRTQLRNGVYVLAPFRMQLKIRGVKVYVLGRLGPNCKSVYVLIDFPEDPAFLLRVYTLGPLKTILIQDKT